MRYLTHILHRVFQAYFLLLPAHAIAAPCADGLFEIFKSENTVYLRNNSPSQSYNLQFVPDGGNRVQSVHDLVQGPDDWWYTAIWVGSDQSGQLLVSNSTQTCELTLETSSERTKPQYSNTIVANTNNITSKIREVNQLSLIHI